MTASMAKVAMLAAIPDSRIRMRPTMRANNAARSADSIADGRNESWWSLMKNGRPRSENFFIMGGIVNQAVA